MKKSSNKSAKSIPLSVWRVKIYKKLLKSCHNLKSQFNILFMSDLKHRNIFHK